MTATRAHRAVLDAEVLRAAALLRPDEDAVQVAARAAWTVLVEPGDGVAGTLIAAYGPVEALELAMSDSSLLPDIGDAKAMSEARARWRPRADPRAVADALHGCREVGGRMLLPGDPDWPIALDDLGPHAPIALWVRGGAEALTADRSVSIVGARAATPYGETAAAELAGDLAADGTVVVSGGAYGIDGAAHRAALGAGGQTVAFLAGGVDRAYPIGHQQLFDRIRGNGAVLSEVPCGAAPTKWRFLQRNRLIAAAGLATVVVEAGWRSGSLNTAGHASSLGRPLGAVPGPISSAASAGCHRLLREYDAICVTNAEEVRELWGGGGRVLDPTPAEDPDRRRLLDALSDRTPLTPEELARRTGLPTERVRGLLGLLGVEGAARSHDSGWIGQTRR
ncbi:DNA-processing protein DprA [Microbacterium sp.]|uniref:DNA-processing protein DprA n=1 Tax=Microbacterium sp. TaxID=51671 RepID=UPI002811D599|nr:DNA-processing protein DprA [Microbacterium sp.]